MADFFDYDGTGTRYRHPAVIGHGQRSIVFRVTTNTGDYALRVSSDPARQTLFLEQANKWPHLFARPVLQILGRPLSLAELFGDAEAELIREQLERSATLKFWDNVPFVERRRVAAQHYVLVLMPLLPYRLPMERVRPTVRAYCANVVEALSNDFTEMPMIPKPEFRGSSKEAMPLLVDAIAVLANLKKADVRAALHDRCDRF